MITLLASCLPAPFENRQQLQFFYPKRPRKTGKEMSWIMPIRLLLAITGHSSNLQNRCRTVLCVRQGEAAEWENISDRCNDETMEPTRVTPIEKWAGCAPCATVYVMSSMSGPDNEFFCSCSKAFLTFTYLCALCMFFCFLWVTSLVAFAGRNARASLICANTEHGAEEIEPTCAVCPHFLAIQIHTHTKHHSTILRRFM